MPAIVVLCLVCPVHGLHIVDDTGRTIALERPAKRIIALYGAYNEILAAMGLEERLVARTKIDRLPPSIVSKPSIGTHMRPNVEMVLALKPDLIIQGGGRRLAMMPVNQLRDQGMRVAVFSPVSFQDLFSVIERLGTLTGEPQAARGVVASMKARLDRVKKKLKGISRRPRVCFEVRYPNFLAAGKKSIVSDVIEHAGGLNCISVEKKLVRVNIETLIECNPQYYIIQKGAMNRNPGTPADRPHFHVLDAIKQGRVLTVDEQVFSRPGPRSVDAVEILARFMHSEMWKK